MHNAHMGCHIIWHLQVDLPRATLAAHNEIQTVVVNSYDYGWAVARRRRWTVLIHWRKCNGYSFDLQSFCKLFCRKAVMAFPKFMISPASDAQAALHWAVGRPSVLKVA